MERYEVTVTVRMTVEAPSAIDAEYEAEEYTRQIVQRSVPGNTATVESFDAEAE